MYQDKWEQFLKCTKKINLSIIHGEQQKTFQELYKIEPALQTFVTEVTDTLNNAGSENIIIHGPKGCGKTSFSYYLKRILWEEDKDFQNQYVIEILHMGRMVVGGGKSLDEKKIDYELSKVLKRYLLSHNSIDEDTLAPMEHKSDVSKTISDFKDFIKERKSLKKLLFILDNVDTYSYDVVNNIVSTVCSKLGPTYIIKCINIRTKTYERALTEHGNYIDTYFQIPIEFPLLSLAEIANHRVNCARNDKENIYIFEDELCNLIKSIHSYDLRHSLVSLRSLLKNIPPQKNWETQKIIQNNIIKKSLDVLIGTRRIKNLYSNHYRISDRYSAVRETLLLLNYNQIVDKTFKRRLIDKYYFDTRVIQEALNILEEEEFIHKRREGSGESVIYDVSKMGKRYISFCNQKGYADICRRYLEGRPPISGEYLWKKASAQRTREELTL